MCVPKVHLCSAATLAPLCYRVTLRLKAYKSGAGAAALQSVLITTCRTFKLRRNEKALPATVRCFLKLDPWLLSIRCRVDVSRLQPT